MEGVSDEAEAFLEKLLGSVPGTPPVQDLLDARLDRVDRGKAVFSMDADASYHNSVRVVHGGIVTSLAELAASTAVMTVLDDDEAFTFVSQTTNYERPVVDERILATADVIRHGSRISFIQVVVRNEDDDEVARAEFTALSQPID